ncbi:2OG-Fe(II) oxygenase [Streptomyces sp. NPDC001410]|uniref:2OG-Fe(II) oxygenase n=1 Tax=Streptomyces sp. NPDC001410 TaxID=3364574 RepID=UPI0036C444AB
MWCRHRFGSGGYRYVTHDLPAPVTALRATLYPRLLPIARDWVARLDRPAPWPRTAPTTPAASSCRSSGGLAPGPGAP